MTEPVLLTHTSNVRDSDGILAALAVIVPVCLPGSPNFRTSSKVPSSLIQSCRDQPSLKLSGPFHK